VGKSGINDNNKIKIPGTLFIPKKKSDVIIHFTGGCLIDYKNYERYFGRYLGEFFYVYMTGPRNGGLASGKKLKEDHYQISHKLTEILGKDKKLFYIGHSMGCNISLASKNINGSNVKGYYAICPYPSFGETRVESNNILDTSIEQKLLDLIYLWDFGPFSLPIKEERIGNPSRVALADNDEIIRTSNQKIAERFMNYFSKQNSQTKIFKDRNHNFNKYLFGFDKNKIGLLPFNKYEPEELVYDIVEFIYKNKDN